MMCSRTRSSQGPRLGCSEGRDHWCLRGILVAPYTALSNDQIWLRRSTKELVLFCPRIPPVRVFVWTDWSELPTIRCSVEVIRSIENTATYTMVRVIHLSSYR